MEAHADTIAIIVAILGTSAALWRINKADMNRLHGTLTDIRHDVGELRERMARLEGLFEGFTKRAAAGDGD